MKKSTVMFICVTFAFVVLCGAWTTLFILAHRQNIREAPLVSQSDESRRGQ